jgi:hypothetical protein
MLVDEVEPRDLPFQGEVRELRVIGNGKDCVLQVWVPNGSGFAIPLSEARASVTCGDGVVVDTRARDDLDLEICYRPSAGRRMRIASAKVSYPGSEDDWACDCETWRQMSRAKWLPESSWAVLDIDVTLTTWIDPGTDVLIAADS